MSMKRLRHRIDGHLQVIYPERKAAPVRQQLIDAMGYSQPLREPPPYQNYWDEEDCWVITYGSTLHADGKSGLSSLRQFLDDHLADAINGVHILPFFPFSSDDGFAVIDYLAVDPNVGSWQELESLSRRYKLMADLVINHASSQSEWFRNYLKDAEPGRGYFVEASPKEDLSAVVRPRSTPLLTRVETASGERWVWCTFGPDQVDVDFSNPQVLTEFVAIIAAYLDHGIRVLRLDAVGFLWKEPGTPCLHHQKTHEIIKLLRTLIEFRDPGVMLITETNVPNRDNLTYFGNGNEAHAIYNFSLPPLVVFTLLSGDCRYLKSWMMSMPPARQGTTYFNFLASHDGIGLRPAEGLLEPVELDRMLDTLKSFGARISTRTGPDGLPHPYEVNISLIDALSGTFAGRDSWQVQRMLCAHAIMLGLEGIPGIYIHSLLGTHNDLEAVARTGHNRSINRHVWDMDALEEALNGETDHAAVLSGLKRLIGIRRRQKAFHPNAVQFTLHLGLQIFAFWRQSVDREQSIFCLNNISAMPQTVACEDLNLIVTDTWWDLIANDRVDPTGEFVLQPYQTMWLSNCGDRG